MATRTKISCSESCVTNETLTVQLLRTARADGNHPCYDENAHKKFARIHLPVTKGCNIQCNYCNRKYDCSNESRPGVSSELLTPKEACARVTKTITLMPNLSVVGFAGPGDPLAYPSKTLETMALIRERHPDILLCVSTNGLTLDRYVNELIALGVRYVTVTVNAVDALVAQKIYSWVIAGKARITGREGAELLLARQQEGIATAIEAGMFCKINSVLIPGINDAHIVEVNQAMSELGVYMHNIMPLISDPSHGTAFGLAGVPSATTEQVTAIRDACQGQVRMMRHCRQCRADAVGLLGEC